MEKVVTILLVDDDTDDQLYFKDALREVGTKVLCKIVNNGSEALNEMKVPPPPDLIFMDLNMPVMNGYECLVELKKESRFSNIPVVIFTTSKSAQDIQKSKELGASLYFTKPSNFRTLCHKLDEIVKLDFASRKFMV